MIRRRRKPLPEPVRIDVMECAEPIRVDVGPVLEAFAKPTRAEWTALALTTLDSVLRGEDFESGMIAAECKLHLTTAGVL